MDNETKSLMELIQEQAMRLMEADGEDDINIEVARSKGLSEMVRTAQDSMRIANDTAQVRLEVLKMVDRSVDADVRKMAKSLVCGNGR